MFQLEYKPTVVRSTVYNKSFQFPAQTFKQAVVVEGSFTARGPHYYQVLTLGTQFVSATRHKVDRMKMNGK